MRRQQGSGSSTHEANDKVLATMFGPAPKDFDLFYTSLLGLKVKNLVELIEKLQSGLPYSSWKYFSEETGFTETEMLKLTHMSRSTLNRRKKGNTLDPLESERLARVARVFSKILLMFRGDLSRVHVWFTTPRPTLGGKTPFEMTISEIGALEVEDVIGRIQYGIYS